MRIKREDVDRGRAEHHEVPIVRVQPLFFVAVYDYGLARVSEYTD